MAVFAKGRRELCDVPLRRSTNYRLQHHVTRRYLRTRCTPALHAEAGLAIAPDIRGGALLVGRPLMAGPRGEFDSGTRSPPCARQAHKGHVPDIASGNTRCTRRPFGPRLQTLVDEFSSWE